MTNHSTVLCTPAHRDTSPTLKGSWSHAHRGLSAAHLASHGNLELKLGTKPQRTHFLSRLGKRSQLLGKGSPQQES